MKVWILIKGGKSSSRSKLRHTRVPKDWHRGGIKSKESPSPWGTAKVQSRMRSFEGKLGRGLRKRGKLGKKRIESNLNHRWKRGGGQPAFVTRREREDSSWKEEKAAGIEVSKKAFTCL